MAVAEIQAEALGRQHVALGRRDVDAGVAHVVQPGRMRGDEVIVVDAVLDQQLPVRLDVVFLHAGDDLHLAGRRLIDHEIDVVLGAGEIGVQVRRVRIEIGEIEILVVLEPRHRHEALALLVEARRIGVVAGNALDRAVGVVGPAVIDAVELPGVALALATHQRAAMAADVEQRADLALPVAAEDHRTAGDAAGAEVARVLHLRGVADIDPALVEDRAVFVLQDVRGDEHAAVDLERQVLQVLDDELAVAVGMAVFAGLSSMSSSSE